MRARLLVLLVVLPLGLAASAQGGSTRASEDILIPDLAPASHLSEALTQIGWALDHEDDAGDALDEGGYAAGGYAAGEIEDGQGHLENALDALAAAVLAGEIDADSAAHIAAHINEAGQSDEDVLNVMDKGGTLGNALDALGDAYDDKLAAGDLIAFGEPIIGAGLGCVLNVSPFAMEGFFVGFDDCTTPIRKIVLRFDTPIASALDGYVGEGSTLLSTFPCRARTYSITCEPATPVKAPQYIFTGFGPVPSTLSLAYAIAYGTDGKAQKEQFTVGSGAPTTDLAIDGKLSWVTPRGFQAPAAMGDVAKLGVGLRYAYDVSLRNQGASYAPNTLLEVDLPDGFKPFHLSKDCTLGGGMLRCPVGSLDPGRGRMFSLYGTFSGAGALEFHSKVTSGATETGSGANEYSTDVKVYGTPKATISAIGRTILSGHMGRITGRAAPGATFEPALEKVTKVELAVQRLGGKTCLWLGPKGRLVTKPSFAGACSEAVWLRAKGTSSWTFDLLRALPDGRYRVLARGTNAAGIFGTTFGGAVKNSLEFRVQ